MDNNFRKNLYKKFKNVTHLSETAKLHYVIIFWLSPFQTLEYRVGYFEAYTEARTFSERLQKDYDELKFPYIIYTNMDTIDGKLLENI